jgi:hypothetical protein
MSSLSCNFCARGNPEGSKFCNECGSPLNLTLCSRCEAINNVSAKQCYQCGAPLPSAETVDTAIPAAALTEIAQNAERVPTKVDPIPIALEERLGALLGDPRGISHEPQATTVEDPPSPATALTADPASHNDDGSLNPIHATYPGRNPTRAYGFILVVVLVALAGAVYWASVNPTHPPSLRTMAGGESKTPPESASSTPAAQAEPAENPKQSPTEDPLPTAGPLPLSAGSFESPATGRESISPSAEAGPSTTGSSESSATTRDSRSLGADAAPPVAGQAPESENAQGPSHAGAVESLGGGTAKITNARGNGDPRVVMQSRRKEQAERDAIATQRLIARELTDAP